MREVVTYVEKLREIALDHHGLVTTSQALADGIPRTELPRLAARGRIERIAHGIYRVPQVPSTGHDNLALAIMWAGPQTACLSHDTALASWDVSDINPESVHLTLPPGRRLRRSGGERYVIHRRELEPPERSHWEGLPITSLPRTIEDCIESGVATYLIRQALDRAEGTSVLPASTHRQLLTLLQARDEVGGQ